MICFEPKSKRRALENMYQVVWYNMVMRTVGQPPWLHFDLNYGLWGVYFDRLGTTRWDIFSSLYMIEAGDCYISGDPLSYTGTLSVNLNGVDCLFWSDPNAITYVNVFTSSPVFPEADIADSANYCRNPTSWQGRPWCALTDRLSQFCDVPECPPQPQGRYSNQIGPMCYHLWQHQNMDIKSVIIYNATEYVF